MKLLSLQYTSGQIAQMRETVRQRMLRESPYVRQANFSRLSAADMLLLYRLYDQVFLESALQPLLIAECGRPVSFRVSRGMTSAGGKTSRFRTRMPDGSISTRYEISLSARLLFNSFVDGGRAILVSGRECSDRLDAAMRIMEHELVHLIEMLHFKNSSCGRTRFMTIAQRLFEHRHAKHQLVTTTEQAARTHNVRIGDQVCFSVEGKKLIGMLNRVRVRATVLVPDARGLRYSDGKHYARYYVPLARLRRIEQRSAQIAV